MKWYCEKCKKLHDDNELCPVMKKQLKEHPEWLSEIANFTIVAGENALITGQSLDNVAQVVNKIAGTSFSYEGTQQFARDIQVFRRLNTEAFPKSGVFSSPQNAQAYFRAAVDNPGIMQNLESQITGYSQEVDWLISKQSKISSLYKKSILLDNNAPGIDGVTYNRFTGKKISETTIKASKKPITKNSEVLKAVQKAIDKGTASDETVICGPKGMKAAAKKMGLKNPVEELNSSKSIAKSNERIMNKIADGKAVTGVTVKEAAKQMGQGAIIGAAVSFSISGITNYIRYKNGEIDINEAFINTSEDTITAALVGAAVSGITMYIAPPYGFIAGLVIGFYLTPLCTNILDEIFGKGAFGAILNASGCVYGMTYNLADYYEKFEINRRKTLNNIESAKKTQAQIEESLDIFEKMKEE